MTMYLHGCCSEKTVTDRRRCVYERGRFRQLALIKLLVKEGYSYRSHGSVL